jgi:flagellar hook-length control protein FliK
VPLTAAPALPATDRSGSSAGQQADATLAGDARPEPVASQLATVLTPAARQADGSYQVNIRLQPEELGVVHVELHMEGSTVNVSLHADGDATRDLLRQNLGQLRQQLESGGLTTGRFDVGSGPGSDDKDASAGQDRAPVPAERAGYQGAPVTATAAGGTPALAPSPANGLLDVRL